MREAPSPSDAPGAQASLCAQLKAATWAQHQQAERCELMRDLLQGRLTPPAYGTLLAGLLEIYRALEAGLARHATHGHIAPWMEVSLQREAALERDLDDLHGPDWDRRLVCPAEAHAYATHLAQLAHDDPGLLTAHAYVRYLGDLHGGQMLARVVARHLAPADGRGLAFYDFGDPHAVRGRIARLRAGLDAVPLDAAARQRLVDEACDAYARHTRLFAEVQAGPV